MNKKHNNKFNYSKFTTYDNIEQKIIVGCPTHGDWIVTVSKHLTGKGCSKCSKEEKQKIAFQNFVNKSNKIHNYKYSYIYNNFESSKRTPIMCKIHGIFNQVGWHHLLGSECPKCSKENRALTQEEFIERASEIHKNKYDYSLVEYRFVSIKVKILCLAHGEFEQLPSAHLYARQGCPNCSKIISKDESDWLDFLNIPPENRNKYLKVNSKVFFPDALDADNKIIYEYYGDYWHGNCNVYHPQAINKLNKMKYIDLYNRTMVREKFLQDAGYRIVSIWESDWLNSK